MDDKTGVHGLPAKLRRLAANDGRDFSAGVSGDFLANRIEYIADELEAALRQSGGAVDLAARFHEAYERLAPEYGYETRHETRRFDPTTPNGRLMVAVCAELFPAPPARPSGLVEALRDALEAGDDGDWQSARNVIRAALAAHDARGG